MNVCYDTTATVFGIILPQCFIILSIFYNPVLCCSHAGGEKIPYRQTKWIEHIVPEDHCIPKTFFLIKKD